MLCCQLIIYWLAHTWPPERILNSVDDYHRLLDTVYCSDWLFKCLNLFALSNFLYSTTCLTPLELVSSSWYVKRRVWLIRIKSIPVHIQFQIQCNVTNGWQPKQIFNSYWIRINLFGNSKLKRCCEFSGQNLTNQH